MTRLLEIAIEEATKLPAAEQDALASLLLAEMKPENAWNESFRAGADRLSRKAAAALEEFRAGQTEALDPDHL